MTGRPDIIFEKRNRCGLITLNRDKGLNALTYDMIGQMEDYYREWAQDLDIYVVVMQSTDPRAFSSGGDLRALYEWRQRGDLDSLLGLYGTEYQHNWSLDRFLKPNVALIDGVVMGGGVGVSIHGTHRVAGESTKFAMPEVGIGFFPDVGATHFLPRCPGRTGCYLALTGRAVGQADAYYLGMATHCIPAARFDGIRDALANAEPVDHLLEDLHQDPGEGELSRLRPVIDRIFELDTVEEILARLDAETGEHAEWARGAAAEIRKASPLSVKIALRQMKDGAAMSLDDALKLEFRIARRFIEGDEFYEGIRAAIIDKDGKPRWQPGTLEEVSDEMVDGYFVPLQDGELELTDPFRQGEAVA